MTDTDTTSDALKILKHRYGEPSQEARDELSQGYLARAEKAEADRDRLRELFADSVSAIQRRYGLGYATAAKIQADAMAALDATGGE